MFAWRNKSGPGLRSLGGLARDEGGAIAVIVALMLAALVGMMALAVDLGRTWNLDTELQHAVDSCALAAATQLDGENGARRRGVQACMTEIEDNFEKFSTLSLNPGKSHLVTYEKVLLPTTCADPANCVLSNGNFRFLKSLDPETDAISDSEARFVRVQVQRTLRMAFAPVVGGVSQASPYAMAMAGQDTFICGVMPIMMCNPQEDPLNEELEFPFDASKYFGHGVTIKDLGKGSQLIAGGFAWLRVQTCDPDTGKCTDTGSVPEMCDMLATVNPQESCIGTEVVIKTGDIAALLPCINMRLDIYPDQGGEKFDANYQPAVNHLSGLVPDGSTEPDQCAFNPAAGNPNGGGKGLKKLDPTVATDGAYLGPLKADGSPRHVFNGPKDFTPFLKHMGYPRDDCAYRDEYDDPITDVDGNHCIFAPNPNLKEISAGSQVGNSLWDFDTYMNFHHDGVTVTFDPFDCLVTPCELPSDSGTVNVDLDGNGSVSRFEISEWERLNLIYEADFGRSQCFSESYGDLPVTPPFEPGKSANRRIIGIAVANCYAITAAGGGTGKNKKKPIPLASGNPAVNIFLTEAAGELDPQAFYGEIVSPQFSGESAVVVHKRFVLVK